MVLPYFMLVIGHVLWTTSLAAVLASFCTIWGIAGFAYFINDLADIKSDQQAGRKNIVGQCSAIQRALLVLFLLGMALLPWLYLPISPITGTLLILEFVLFLLYACPPFRWKEKAWLGPLTDALYAHVNPALLATLTFYAFSTTSYPLLPFFLMTLALWQFALGMRIIPIWMTLCGMDTPYWINATDSAFALAFDSSRVTRGAFQECTSDGRAGATYSFLPTDKQTTPIQNHNDHRDMYRTDFCW